ncbi:MAG: FAD-dependent oxidoreductase [Pseudomonadota bacterium]
MDTEILIVGGGLAGLALADKLHEQGRDWILLEARDRLGGRIFSLDADDAKFDMGPTWFWPGQPRMEKLSERLSITSFEQYSKGALAFQDHTGAVRINHGYASMHGSLRLAGGMGSLIDALQATLPAQRILLNSALTQLEQTTQGVTARAGEHAIDARRVVLALPPRVVSELVEFTPQLDQPVHDLMRAVSTWMAGQAKIVAVYDKPYWREAGFSGDAISQRGPMVEIHDASPVSSGPYALFGFVGVPASVRAGRTEQLIELAKTQLATIFGDELMNPIRIRVMDWAQEHYTAISSDSTASHYHPRYGLPNEFSNIWSGRVVFASSETADQFGGFLEGALESAERAFKALQTTDHPLTSAIDEDHQFLEAKNPR